MSAYTFRVLTMLLMLTLFPAPAPVFGVELPVDAEVEIEILLRYIGNSGCEFFRNGSWNDAKSAEAHLRDKYIYLKREQRIDSSESFIEKVATSSSFTGRAYAVKCFGEDAVTSSQWLHDELGRIRGEMK